MNSRRRCRRRRGQRGRPASRRRYSTAKSGRCRRPSRVGASREIKPRRRFRRVPRKTTSQLSRNCFCSIASHSGLGSSSELSSWPGCKECICPGAIGTRRRFSKSEPGRRHGVKSNGTSPSCGSNRRSATTANIATSSTAPRLFGGPTPRLLRTSKTPDTATLGLCTHSSRGWAVNCRRAARWPG